MTDPYANYETAKHNTLTKLHLFPNEKCQHDDTKHAKKIKTRKEMFAAILRTTSPNQLCEHEYDPD